MFFNEFSLNLSIGKVLSISEIILDRQGFTRLYDQMTNDEIRHRFFSNDKGNYFDQIRRFLKEFSYPTGRIESFIKELKSYMANGTNESIIRDYVRISSIKKVLLRSIDTKSKIINLDSILIDFQESLLVKSVPVHLGGLDYEECAIAKFIVYYFKTMYRLDPKTSKLIYSTINTSSTGVLTSKGDTFSVDRFEFNSYNESGSSFNAKRDIQQIIDCSVLLFRRESNKASKEVYSDLVTQYIQYMSHKNIGKLERRIVEAFYPSNRSRSKDFAICNNENTYFVHINTDIIDTGALPSTHLLRTYTRSASKICVSLFENLFSVKAFEDLNYLFSQITTILEAAGSVHARGLISTEEGPDRDNSLITLQKGAKSLAELIKYCKVKGIDYKKIPFKLFRDSSEFKKCSRLEDYIANNNNLYYSGSIEGADEDDVESQTDLTKALDDLERLKSLEKLKKVNLSNIALEINTKRDSVNAPNPKDVIDRLVLRLSSAYSCYKGAIYYITALSGGKQMTEFSISPEIVYKNLYPAAKSDGTVVNVAESVDYLHVNQDMYKKYFGFCYEEIIGLSCDEDGALNINLRLETFLTYLNLEIVILLRMLTVLCSTYYRHSDLAKLRLLDSGLIQTLPSSIPNADVLHKLELVDFSYTILPGADLLECLERGVSKFSVKLSDFDDFKLHYFMQSGESSKSNIIMSYYTLYECIYKKYQTEIQLCNSLTSKLVEGFREMGITTEPKLLLNKDLIRANIQIMNKKAEEELNGTYDPYDNDSFDNFKKRCNIFHGFLIYRNKPYLHGAEGFYVHYTGKYVPEDCSGVFPMPKGENFQ